MKLLRKITYILLVMAMLPFTAFADTGGDAAAPDDARYNGEACRLLIALGIIDDTFGFQYTKEVSRMEFARVVLKAGGYNSEGFGVSGVFTDVTEDNEYAADIEMLYALGVVSGNGTSTFAPQRSVTCNEAAAMLLRAAGYTDIANAEGGYPEGYMKVAQNRGLLKNVSNLGVINGDDMVILVYNMLTLKTVEFSSTGTYKLDGSDTVLSERHSIYFRKGTVVENGITAMYSASTVGEDSVVIDTGSERVLMTVGDTDIADKIGYRVTAYYKYDKSNDSSECVYYEYESKNRTVTVDIADLETFSDSRIEYSIRDDKTRKLEITGAAIIYNDIYFSGVLPDISFFSDKIGKITAIDNGGDSKYDVVVIEAYTTTVVGNAVTDGRKVYDKETNGETELSDTDVDKYILRMADGKDAVFEDICADTVLSVAKSVPGSGAKSVKAILSTTKASGVVTGIYAENGKTEIELDGVGTYNVLDRVVNIGRLPDAGQGVTLFLDAFGNVAYIEMRFLAESQYGFMVEAGRSKKEDKTYINILLREGVLKKVPLAETAILDGDAYRDSESAYSYILSLPAQAMYGGNLPNGVMPVRYVMNESGEIKTLDTPVRGANEDVNSLTPMNSGRTVFSSSTFGYSVPINGDTTVLRISTPNSEALEYYKEEATYAYQGSSAFRDKKVYKYNAYKLDSLSDYAEFVIYFSSNGFEHDTELTVIKSLDKKMYDGEENDTFAVLEGIAGGKSVKRAISKEFEEEFATLGFKPGDVVRCLYDDNNRLCDIDGPQLSYNENTGVITAQNISDGTSDATRVKNQETSSFVLIGDVAKRREGLVKLNFMSWGGSFSSDDSYGVISGRDEYWVKIDGSVPVTVYSRGESGENMIRSGTYDDIIAMEDSFEKHSIILLRYRSNTLYEVVVYNNIYIN